jgi:hypothetical protein
LPFYRNANDYLAQVEVEKSTPTEKVEGQKYPSTEKSLITWRMQNRFLNRTGFFSPAVSAIGCVSGKVISHYSGGPASRLLEKSPYSARNRCFPLPYMEIGMNLEHLRRKHEFWRHEAPGWCRQIWPRPQSLDYFVKMHRAPLQEAGALQKIGRDWFVDSATFPAAAARILGISEVK